MLKKIQSRLLVNQPLIWNLKLIPMLLVILIFNLVFFCLGYFSTEIDFSNYSYYNYYNSVHIKNYPLYGIGALTSLLTLILWLVFYLKNNGLKVFYPKNSLSLYKEWFFSFFIIIGISLYCFSLYQGSLAKLKSYTSLEKVDEVKTLLTKINFLLPNEYLNTYTYIKTDKNNNVSEEIQEGTSLLSIKQYGYYSGKDSILRNQVYQWLVKEEKDSIRNTIEEYLKLQKKYNLKTNLTADLWMKIIYNPPQYIVTSENFINRYNTNNNSYYVEYMPLEKGYNEIVNAYNSSKFSLNFLLITFYIALAFSLFVFSFRITNGKSWLISIIILGLLLFTSGLFVAFIEFISNSSNFELLYPMYWLFSFFILFIYLEKKLLGKKEIKENSALALNLILWLIPTILPLFLWIYIFWIKNTTDFEDRSDYCLYSYFNDNPDKFFWINLLFIVIILFFFIKQLRKWKSLPEE